MLKDQIASWRKWIFTTTGDRAKIQLGQCEEGSVMDNLLDDIDILIRRCEASANVFERDPIKAQMKSIIQVAERIGESWSGSYLGYHAYTYNADFRKPRPGEHFDSEWGFEGAFSNRTAGRWQTYDVKRVISHIYQLAGNPDLGTIETAAREIGQTFEEGKDELIASIDALLSVKRDDRLRELRDEIAKLRGYISRDELWRMRLPGGTVMSRDSVAMQQGFKCPPHQVVICVVQEQFSYAIHARELAKLARKTKLYLEKSLKMKGATVAKTEGKIFIGHGRSQAWRDLKDFLQDRLRLVPDEFNLQSVAGLATTERLQQMLDDACFAFLIMTAEDQQEDGTLRARENVIHEAGLFQGRLGFRRAIVLLEDGCNEFSNIHGLGQIRFPKGDIKVQFEEIRRVLEREKII